MRGVTTEDQYGAEGQPFLLTRLMRGVTPCSSFSAALRLISTHTPHARRDTLRLWSFATLKIFLLTRLMRGVTLRDVAITSFVQFLLTRLMRGVTYYNLR